MAQVCEKSKQWKEALKLLQTLVKYSPFGASLDSGPMLASQRQFEAELKVRGLESQRGREK